MLQSTLHYTVKGTKMARKSLIRYPDFSIVFRKDRNGFEGWFNGKAEAFRKTEAAVDSFFQKKYGQAGVLVDPGTVLVPTEVVKPAKAPKAVKAPKAPKVVKEKAAPRVERDLDIEPDAYGYEDRLTEADLAVLL
jgi:hypothetical protein